MKELILFGTDQHHVEPDVLEAAGSRGKRAVSLADLRVPICPGVVIPGEALSVFPENATAAWSILQTPLQDIERSMEKRFGEGEAPLLLKVVESPMLNVRSALPSVHHVGLCNTTIDALASTMGETFIWQEYAFLISSILRLELTLEESEGRAKRLKEFREELQAARRKDSIRGVLESFADLLPEQLFTEPFFQLAYVVRLFRAAFALSPTTEDSAIMIQAMVYGNLDSQSASGYLFTHHIITGEDTLQGEYFSEAFDENDKSGHPLTELPPERLEMLQKISRTLEDHFKEVRWIRFTIEGGKLWLVDQASVPNKSAQAEIKTLLDLLRRGSVTEEHVIRTIKPGRLSEILHPTLDAASVADFTTLEGGIAGSVGAAIGRVFFSTERLVVAHRQAQQAGEDTNLILAMPSTFAGDVKGIEIAQGVLSSEGGYASHAPVVARSLGKVALIRPDISFRENSMIIDGNEITEGDFITLEVPYYTTPRVFLGAGSLTKPTPEDSGLLELLDIVQRKIGRVEVHANADQPRDAQLAKLFGARGIGLCRTEHMFFAENRINRFRYMIIARDEETRTAILDDLHKDQTEDFYQLLKIMDGLPVTIRLLDAPLHEFLPQGDAAMKDFAAQAKKDKMKFTKQEIIDRSQLLREFNPMLGHRGIRIAISYPEIYRMQTRAIFEAAYKLKAEGFSPRPEIMIPLVMNPHELKVVRNGKRIEGKHILGIRDIEREVSRQFQAGSLDYKVGTMIELPAAALNASEIARYADFFSFGTNDLTQTTYGISRDDFNTFFSDYTELDLLEGNPFKRLQPQVRELVQTAALRGKMVRPDITLGLCGEHGAEPENITFIQETGLDYVSVSPFGIPIAKLAIAQMNLGHA
ncbi:putative PEP-binding protein [Alkalispirochaeta alkalica]|uniref:putative PEP-binding protein n=1 Tax=Alkalispirochaeta alkalica TaxID=46356 RepID=UPI00037557C1|nr:putative PEP-binding protein [Alkalispirochaeta alkalica]